MGVCEGQRQVSVRGRRGTACKRKKSVVGRCVGKVLRVCTHTTRSEHGVPRRRGMHMCMHHDFRGVCHDSSSVALDKDGTDCMIDCRSDVVQ